MKVHLALNTEFSGVKEFSEFMLSRIELELDEI